MANEVPKIRYSGFWARRLPGPVVVARLIFFPAKDFTMIESIRSQTLALIAEITSGPKPSYYIDGQQVSWAEYLDRLQKTVDWCDRKIALAEPTEVVSQAWCRN